VNIGQRLGSYELLTSIGAGGMGEVFRARDTKLDREVAIKVLPAAFAAEPERLARFEREASTLASRSKRARRSGSCANAAGRTLIATSRPSLVSFARYTSPIPPTPMAAVISCVPRRALSVTGMNSRSLAGCGV